MESGEAMHAKSVGEPHLYTGSGEYVILDSGAGMVTSRLASTSYNSIMCWLMLLMMLDDVNTDAGWKVTDARCV